MFLLIEALSNNIHIIPIIGKVTLKIFSKVPFLEELAPAYKTQLDLVLKLKLVFYTFKLFLFIILFALDSTQ